MEIISNDTTKSHNNTAPCARVMDVLYAQHARSIASVDGPLGSEIRFMQLADGRLRIVQVFQGGGVEIYKPVATSNSIDDAIRAALEPEERGELAWAGPRGDLERQRAEQRQAQERIVGDAPALPEGFVDRDHDGLG